MRKPKDLQCSVDLEVEAKRVTRRSLDALSADAPFIRPGSGGFAPHPTFDPMSELFRYHELIPEIVRRAVTFKLPPLPSGPPRSLWVRDDDRVMPARLEELSEFI